MAGLITFVCLGNICRSPMGERVAITWAERAGLELSVDSAGVSDWERGNPIDPRAAHVLTAHGYPSGEHRAKQATPQLIAQSAIVLAFEPSHLTQLRPLATDTSKLHLVTDFDPGAPRGSGIDDPWFGSLSDFEATLAAIEAAMPGIIARARLLAQ